VFNFFSFKISFQTIEFCRIKVSFSKTIGCQEFMSKMVFFMRMSNSKVILRIIYFSLLYLFIYLKRSIVFWNFILGREENKTRVSMQFWVHTKQEKKTSIHLLWILLSFVFGFCITFSNHKIGGLSKNGHVKLQFKTYITHQTHSILDPHSFLPSPSQVIFISL